MYQVHNCLELGCSAERPSTHNWGTEQNHTLTWLKERMKTCRTHQHEKPPAPDVGHILASCSQQCGGGGLCATVVLMSLLLFNLSPLNQCFIFGTRSWSSLHWSTACACVIGFQGATSCATEPLPQTSLGSYACTRPSVLCSATRLTTERTFVGSLGILSDKGDG